MTVLRVHHVANQAAAPDRAALQLVRVETSPQAARQVSFAFGGAEGVITYLRIQETDTWLCCDE